MDYVLSLKTTRMQAVVTAIGSGGKLELGTAGMASVLATFTLDATAGTVTGDTLTFSGMPKTVAAALAGTIAAARIRTSADADVITNLTAGTSAADVIVSSTTVAQGQDVIVNSATIQHA